MSRQTLRRFATLRLPGGGQEGSGYPSKVQVEPEGLYIKWTRPDGVINHVTWDQLREVCRDTARVQGEDRRGDGGGEGC